MVGLTAKGGATGQGRNCSKGDKRARGSRSQQKTATNVDDEWRLSAILPQPSSSNPLKPTAQSCSTAYGVHTAYMSLTYGCVYVAAANAQHQGRSNVHGYNGLAVVVNHV